MYIYLTVNSAVLLLSSADFLALSLRMNPTVLQFKWTFLAELSLLVFFTLGLYKKKSESVGEFFGHCEPGNLSKGRTTPCFEGLNGVNR